MNTKDIVKELALKFNISQKDARNHLDNTLEVFKEVFIEEKGITLQNFGTFDIKEKEERKSYNPFLKRYIILPIKRIIYFRASNSLKEQVKTIKS